MLERLNQLDPGAIVPDGGSDEERHWRAGARYLIVAVRNKLLRDGGTLSEFWALFQAPLWESKLYDFLPDTDPLAADFTISEAINCVENYSKLHGFKA